MQSPSKLHLRLITAAILLTSNLHAAPISWGPAVNTTDKSQLIDGNTIYAFSGGSGATVLGGGSSGTQNYAFTGRNYQNTAFLPAPGARITGAISSGAPTTGDTDFDTIIKSSTDSQSGIVSGTQTISGLTNGTSYQVQVFFNDQRAGQIGRVRTYGDGEASPSNQNVAAAGSGWGSLRSGLLPSAGRPNR